MANGSKNRKRRQYYTFFLACLVSLIGLLVYIVCRHKIPFPHQWIPNIEAGNEAKDLAAQTTKLFFSGISVHLQVNFFLGLIFMLLNTEKMDRVKVQKWRFWISRTFIFIVSLVWGLGIYWNKISPKGASTDWGSLLLLSLIITVINLCLLELLIQLMNQYGICNAFNLILFTEFLPLKWLYENWGEKTLLKSLPILFLITIFFVWLTNLKWEAPVETNTLYYGQDSRVLRKSRSKMGLKLSFSFMPLIYLSSFISFIFSLTLMKGNTEWGSATSIYNSYQFVQGEKLLIKNSMEGKSFWECLFNLNENKHIFFWENLKEWLADNKWKLLGALVFLILLRWLVVWVQMRKVSPWKTGEMSKDLRKRGTYINRLPPGPPTRSLLKKIANKLIFFWFFLILGFNIIFDNLFGIKAEPESKPTATLDFFGWFGGVNIGVELIRQIRTKYKYIGN